LTLERRCRSPGWICARIEVRNDPGTVCADHVDGEGRDREEPT
jgi:hypothetical protein